MPDAIPDSSPDRQDPGDAPVVVQDRRARKAMWEDKNFQGQEWTVDMQSEREKTLTKKLKKLKGKFTPYGPKPWDSPAFRSVSIAVHLDPKQASNKKILSQVTEEMRRITGGMPRTMIAKQNMAKTNQRKGFPSGVSIVIKGKLMMDFLTRLNTLVLPRVRDFEGLYPNCFGNTGDFSLTIKGQEPFKELDELLDIREITHNWQITIHTNRFTQPSAMQLMKEFGFPFTDELKVRRKK
ncbi:unnamed protein product, partial [Prorocentrum cordatum]